MKRLTRSLLSVLVTASLASAMLVSAMGDCRDVRSAAADVAHDCESPDAPAPKGTAHSAHEACQMLAPCVNIALAIVSQAYPLHSARVRPQPIARDESRPAAIDRAPVAPPPRA